MTERARSRAWPYATSGDAARCAEVHGAADDAPRRCSAPRVLVEGTSGNVSGRVDDGLVCLTPSSVAYDAMTLDDLVIVDLDGNVVEGERSPTTEKALHLACYRAYPEIGGVIHSHPVYATMFALAREPIPAVIEEVVGVRRRRRPRVRLHDDRHRRARRGGRRSG